MPKQQDQELLDFISRSSAVVSPTLYEKSLLAVPRSRNMIEKRTQKKFHNRGDQHASAHSPHAVVGALVCREDASRSMLIHDALT
jgi:hypothetical protein